MMIHDDPNYEDFQKEPLIYGKPHVTVAKVRLLPRVGASLPAVQLRCNGQKLDHPDGGSATTYKSLKAQVTAKVLHHVRIVMLDR